jgi:DNA-binding response OmpR family regulator
MKVLAIDDEPGILETIAVKVRREGCSVFTAETAAEGLRLFRLVKPDIMLIDVMLPDRSGFDLARQVRQTSGVPIIFLTARAAEYDRIEGLELGADDYVTKPFSLAELWARIKSVVRRSSGAPILEPVVVGQLNIDPKTHKALRDGQELDLSPREFDLLLFLASNAGQVFSRDTLIDRVWGQDAFVSPRTVDVHVRWLRKHIESDPSQPDLIQTVRGVGYKFVID